MLGGSAVRGFPVSTTCEGGPAAQSNVVGSVPRAVTDWELDPRLVNHLSR